MNGRNRAHDNESDEVIDFTTGPNDSVSHELGLLRLELMQFERHGNDLMRYKLFAAAVLGGGAVGVGPSVSSAVTWVLAIIPFVCLFVDAAHIQSEAAIMTIARFLRRFPDRPLGKYELYVVEMRHQKGNPIVLHYIVLGVTTVTLSAAIAIGGIVLGLQGELRPLQSVTIAASGFIGIVGGIILHKLRERYLESIDDWSASVD